MDFFAQQDVARRNTRVLVLLFIFAVFLLILLTNALFAAFLYINQDYSVYGGLREGSAGFLSFFTWERPQPRPSTWSAALVWRSPPPLAWSCC